MNEELMSIDTDAQISHREELEEEVRETWRYVENAKSEATRRAYASDWKAFEAYLAASTSSNRLITIMYGGCLTKRTISCSPKLLSNCG